MKSVIHNIIRRLSLCPVYNRFPGINTFRIRGTNNMINARHALLSQSMIHITGNNNVISIGDGSYLKGMDIMISGDGHRLNVGRECRLSGKIKLEDENNEITIGERTTMEDTYLGAYDIGTSIIIGRDCMFSEHVGLRNGDMHSIIDLNTGKRINPSRNIIVYDHVWLARGVTVLKGVSIGTHTIIGANSMVTGDIPAHCLAVGSPAKVLREQVTWDRQRLRPDEVISTSGTP